MQKEFRVKENNKERRFHFPNFAATFSAAVFCEAKDIKVLVKVLTITLFYYNGLPCVNFYFCGLCFLLLN